METILIKLDIFDGEIDEIRVGLFAKNERFFLEKFIDILFEVGWCIETKLGFIL